MAEGYLIDTSAVIKYLNETLPVNGLSFIDKVVEIELQSWNPSDPNDLKNYQLFVSGSKVIGINKSIIDETIRIRKYFKLKLPDAVIAATAIVNDMTLISDNDKDFKKVPELKYINPSNVIS